MGWYGDNSYGATKPVGLKYPNELGIYDMSGNVWEWVEDQYHGHYNRAPDDGSAWVDREERTYRVLRGGSWSLDASYCGIDYRNGNGPSFRHNSVGFRLGLSLPR